MFYHVEKRCSKMLEPSVYWYTPSKTLHTKHYSESETKFIIENYSDSLHIPCNSAMKSFEMSTTVAYFNWAFIRNSWYQISSTYFREIVHGNTDAFKTKCSARKCSLIYLYVRWNTYVISLQPIKNWCSHE